MALDYLREVFAGRDTVPTVEKGTHFLGDLRIDRGALLATGGRDVCGGHCFEPWASVRGRRKPSAQRLPGRLHTATAHDTVDRLTWRTPPD